MIRLLGKIPKNVIVACSGGVDSMAAVDFLKRKHNVELAFFHHRTKTSNIAEQFLKDYCSKNNIKLHVGVLESDRQGRESFEEFWRKERYRFLESFNKTVITCHHLDDVLETWIFYSAHGSPKIIPYRRNNIIRPFLLNKKSELIKWAMAHNVPFVFDESNNDLRYMRNYIRHKVIPVYVNINIGIYKNIRKKIIDNFNKTINQEKVFENKNNFFMNNIL